MKVRLDINYISNVIDYVTWSEKFDFTLICKVIGWESAELFSETFGKIC